MAEDDFLQSSRKRMNYEMKRQVKKMRTINDEADKRDLLCLENQLYIHSHYSESNTPKDTSYPLVPTKGQNIDLSRTDLQGWEIQQLIDENTLFGGPFDQRKWGPNGVHFWRNYFRENTITMSNLICPEIGTSE